jgi:SAM-dependent methyltransferase
MNKDEYNTLKQISTKLGIRQPVFVSKNHVINNDFPFQYWRDRNNIIGDVNNLDVLELGCNAGFDSFLFEMNGAASVTAVDINKDFLQVANISKQSLGSNVKFIQSDANTFINGCIENRITFDVIFFAKLNFDEIENLFKISNKVYGVMVNYDNNENGYYVINPINKDIIEYFHGVEIIKSFDYGGGMKEFWLEFKNEE